MDIQNKYYSRTTDFNAKTVKIDSRMIEAVFFIQS